MFPLLAHLNDQIKIPPAPQIKVYIIILSPIDINHMVSVFLFFITARRKCLRTHLPNDPHEKCMRLFIESGI